jgi:hypothetical protein
MRFCFLITLLTLASAQDCTTDGHLVATATVEYSQWCCVNRGLVLTETFTGAAIEDFVGRYVILDNGSLPVWPTSSYLIANNMTFEFLNLSSSYYQIRYNVDSVPMNYLQQPGITQYSLGNDYDTNNPSSGYDQLTMRAYEAGCPVSPTTTTTTVSIVPALPPVPPPFPPPIAPPPIEPPLPPPSAPPPVNTVALRVILAVVAPVVLFIIAIVVGIWCYREQHTPRVAVLRKAEERLSLSDQGKLFESGATLRPAELFKFVL